MALFIFWKDNTTPGQLLAEEIEFVRAIAPAGQFPVHDCPTDVPLSQRCFVIFTDAAGYIENTNRSLMFWCTLALMYVAMALVTRKYPTSPGKMKLIRLTADDTRLKEIYSANNTDTSEKE
ncbi:TraP protein [Cooperia oncophora]